MNAKLGKRIIEISRALKPQKSTGRAFHTCFAVKKGKIIKIGINNYQKTHNVKRFGKYQNWKQFPTEYTPCVHAESNLISKLGEEDLSGYELVNVRIGNENQVMMSKACCNCANLVSQYNPKTFYYSNDNGEFEQMAI